MLFNSIEFAIFLPVVFVLYWLVFRRRIGWQNVLIVVVSYIFYGWWDWRFLSLIFLSTLVDYCIGVQLNKVSESRPRKLLLWTSLIVNLGMLGTFKYFNFFAENFVELFSLIGFQLDIITINIILPIGISFYTFQTLSYTIDVYRNKIAATHNLVAFAAYVSFFPQLVAGPIERAPQLLPQFFRPRHFSYALGIDGVRQILWGLFMKIVIADNCAIYANHIFGDSDNFAGSTLLIGALMFTFQIYGDFAGYSNIAIGTARLFGFNLMQNFAFPYFSRDIAEFWRRWHISLSTWFKDYLYIPLGGSLGETAKTVRNVFIIFIISGFWHGANWTFIFWGLLNALYFLPLLLLKQNRNNIAIIGSNGVVRPTEVIAMLLTFFLTAVAWIFFRAENLDHAFRYLNHLFSKTLFNMPEILPMGMLTIIVIFLLIEWCGRKESYAIKRMFTKSGTLVNWVFIYILFFAIYLLGNFSSNYEFIYFQF